MSVLAAAAVSESSIPWSVTIPLGILGVLLSLPCWGMFVKGVATMYKTITIGQASTTRIDNPIARVITTIREVLGHTKMFKKKGIAVAHWFVMVGFLLGSMLWFEAYIQVFNPAGGWPIIGDLAIYHLADELLGIGTVLGIVTLSIVRQVLGDKSRYSRFYGSNKKAAIFVEGVVLLEGIGMMMVKAGKIATFEKYHGGHLLTDFWTMQLAQILPASAVMVSIFALVKLMSGMVWLFVVGRRLTWGVAWHRFLAFFNIFLKRNADGRNALGAAKPMTSKGKVVSLEEADPEEDTIGVGKIEDFTWKAMLDFTSCTECGRCQEQCPAWNTAKPLSPKLLVNRLRDHAYDSAPYILNRDKAGAEAELTGDAAVAVKEREAEGDLHDLPLLQLIGEGEMGVIDPDILWSCTNCGACVEQCPVDIEHIDHIVDMRRFQVLVESDFPTELAGLFKNMETKGNPWGQNNNVRAEWIKQAKEDGIEVPVFGEDIENFDDTEYLFWVGCAGVYDDNAKKTTRAVAELLYTAGVKFAVLSEAETCNGDSARRAGNEFLFQMLAEQNIETLNNTFEGVPPEQRKIVVTCAHCFNTLRNEYPEMGGTYEVVHHTQLLNKLVRQGRIKPIAKPQGRKVTYHDPCFLGRHNKVFEAPRELIGAAGLDLVEMDRNRNTGFCCGAGGARMWMEEDLGERINLNRTDEALSTLGRADVEAPQGGEEIAVGCPFCKTMISDGVNNRQGDIEDKKDRVQVNDIAQMFRDSVLVDGELPEPKEPAFLVEPIRGWEPPAEPEPEPEPQPEPEPEKPKQEKKAAAAPAGAAGAPAPGGAPKPGAPAAGAPAPGGAPKPGAPAPGAPAPGGAPKPGAPAAGAPAPGGAPKPGAPAAGAPAPGGAPTAPGAPAAPAAGGAPKAPGAPAAPAAGGAPKAPSSPQPVTAGPPKPPGAPAAPGAPKAPAASAPAAQSQAEAQPQAVQPAEVDTAQVSEQEDAQTATPAGKPQGGWKATTSAPAAPGAPKAPAAAAQPQAETQAQAKPDESAAEPAEAQPATADTAAAEEHTAQPQEEATAPAGKPQGGWKATTSAPAAPGASAAPSAPSAPKAPAPAAPAPQSQAEAHSTSAEPDSTSTDAKSEQESAENTSSEAEAQAEQTKADQPAGKPQGGWKATHTAPGAPGAPGAPKPPGA